MHELKKETVKKDIVRFWRPPPKWVKSVHSESEKLKFSSKQDFLRKNFRDKRIIRDMPDFAKNARKPIFWPLILLHHLLRNHLHLNHPLKSKAFSETNKLNKQIKQTN